MGLILDLKSHFGLSDRLSILSYEGSLALSAVLTLAIFAVIWWSIGDKSVYESADSWFNELSEGKRKDWMSLVAGAYLCVFFFAIWWSVFR